MSVAQASLARDLALRDAQRVVAAIVHRNEIRAAWARSRGPVAAVLVFVASGLWAVTYHEQRVGELTRERDSALAALEADRRPVTFIATGCGRRELESALAQGAGALDVMRARLTQ